MTLGNSTIIEVILGAIVAIAMTIFLEWLRKPHLEIKIAPSTHPNYEDSASRPAKQATFAHLRVVNKPLPSRFKWMSRDTAMQCYGVISFHYLDGHCFADREMPIRWCKASEPQPVLPLRYRDGRPFCAEHGEVVVIDERRITVETRMDIYPNETGKVFDVAARFDDEDEYYGWSNRSYFRNWRDSEWKLTENRYLVTVTIYSATEPIMDVFRLVKGISRTDLRLENASQDDKKNVQRSRSQKRKREDSSAAGRSG